MKLIIKHFASVLLFAVSVFALASCSDDNTSDLRLDGDTWITSFALDEYEGVIDNVNRTVTVGVPENYNTRAMTVTDIKVSEGAVASMKVGDLADFSVPQNVQVVNGDAYFDYTVNVVHDAARILSFKANGYIGVINEDDRTIIVRVPTSTDITSMVTEIVTSEGATVAPASGQPVDFTNPVDFTVTYKTATAVYRVTVIKSDSPSAVYVGLASTIDGLGYEERAAADWMLKNVANSQYVSFEDIRNGNVDLGECKVMWWHLHIDGGIDNMDKFDAAAPAALQALPAVKDFYNNGGCLLLTRFATYYAAKLGATADGNNPNNCWGQVEESGEITSGPWSFFVDGHENHPIYQGLVTTIDGKQGVYTCDAGYRITNSTCQWHIGSDWGGYPTLDDWRNLHGGLDLGYGGDGAVVVWEYPANAAGGRVLCIGSGAYDWYSYGVDASGDQYHGNVAMMTLNAINYLQGE